MTYSLKPGVYTTHQKEPIVQMDPDTGELIFPEPTRRTSMELETINKLFLELSQVATAKTGREIDLESLVHAVCDMVGVYVEDAEEELERRLKHLVEACKAVVETSREAPGDWVAIPLAVWEQCLAAEPTAEVGDRKVGHSKLVYDKALRTIVTVDPNPYYNELMDDEEYNKKLLEDGDWPRELGPRPGRPGEDMEGVKEPMETTKDHRATTLQEKVQEFLSIMDDELDGEKGRLADDIRYYVNDLRKGMERILDNEDLYQDEEPTQCGKCAHWEPVSEHEYGCVYFGEGPVSQDGNCQAFWKR